MSECVVRMEMPEDCFECPFGIIDDTEDGVWCNALAQQSSGQREDCPIVCQLPEGHGRLVDKDEMLKKIENYHRYMTVGRESDPRCIIEDAPTIVPAERRANDGTDKA